MIEPIGKVRRLGGIAKAARKAAIFFRVDTDVCAALSRTDPTWDAQMRKHAPHLVGVYSVNHSGYRLAQWISADMQVHERGATA